MDSDERQRASVAADEVPPLAPIPSPVGTALRDLARRLRAIDPEHIRDLALQVHAVAEQILPLDAFSVELVVRDRVMIPFAVDRGRIEAPDVVRVRPGSAGAWAREHRRPYLFSQDGGALMGDAVPLGRDAARSADVLIAPVIDGSGAVHGVLGIHSLSPGCYGAREARIAEALAGILGAVLGRGPVDPETGDLYDRFPELAPDPRDPFDQLHEAVSMLEKLQVETEQLVTTATQTEGDGSPIARRAAAVADLGDTALGLLLALARSGVDRARAPRPEVDLTPREREVARMILEESATNAQIASRLFIAEKTVKAHVGSVLRKCGQTQRSGLALVLDARALTDGEAPGDEDAASAAGSADRSAW